MHYAEIEDRTGTALWRRHSFINPKPVADTVTEMRGKLSRGIAVSSDFRDLEEKLIYWQGRPTEDSALSPDWKT